jgi:hypothetical protein
MLTSKTKTKELKMPEERRRCTATYDGETFEEYFECYGNEQKFNESNDSYAVLVAIIEKLDGQVITVPPRDVKFVHPET